MERKVFLISNSTQKQVIIDSKAETLGQLKKELDELNINYRDMAFFEGRTKIELKSDDTILPSNFSFKGAITNDLTIMLTTPHKKIKSGIMTRKECYDYIKNAGLSKAFTEAHGKNYTNASTVELNEFCNISENIIVKEVTPEEVKEEKLIDTNITPQVEEITERNNNVELYLKEILSILRKLDSALIRNYSEQHKESLTENKVETKEKVTEKEVKEYMSQTEISEMFDFI